MVTRGEMDGKDCSCISPTKPEVMLPETTPTGRRPSLAPEWGREGTDGEREREIFRREPLSVQSFTSNCSSLIKCTIKSPEVRCPVGVAETPLEGEKPR